MYPYDCPVCGCPGALADGIHWDDCTLDRKAKAKAKAKDRKVRTFLRRLKSSVL